MSKEANKIQKDSFLKDLSAMSYSIEMLRKKVIEKENFEMDSETQSALKLFYDFAKHTGEEHIKDILDKSEISKKYALREANEKIRELQLNNGNEVSCENAQAFVKVKSKEIEEALSFYGLNFSLDFSIGCYGFNGKINVYSVHCKPFSTSFNSSEADIESRLKDHSQQRDKVIKEFVMIGGEREKYVQFNESNLCKIKEILSSVMPEVMLREVSSRKYGKNEKSHISTVDFFVNSNDVFLGMR